MIILLWPIGNMVAQECHVAPIQKTTLHTTQAEMMTYISGSFSGHSEIGIAQEAVSKVDVDRKLYARSVSAGIGAKVYNTKYEWLQFNMFLGYLYQVHSYQKSVAASAGVYNHWLQTDANIMFIPKIVDMRVMGIGMGLKSDILLANSNIKNSKQYSYVGLNNECFNKATLGCHASIMFLIPHIDFELRVGSYIIPQLNPQKISYYNFTKSKVSGFYFEIRSVFRIVMTGKEGHDL